MNMNGVHTGFKVWSSSTGDNLESISKLIQLCNVLSISKNQTPWPESANELYRSSDNRLSPKLVPTVADRRCHVVSLTDPNGRILGFLDRSRYFFFQVAPQLYSRGWVDLVSYQQHLWNSGNAENQTRTSGSVARNSDDWTTEAVPVIIAETNNTECFWRNSYRVVSMS
jgi:hypothetical protein